MPKAASAPTKQFSLEAGLRVVCGREVALGPGKVALLDAIAAKGTLAGSAEHLGISTSRASKLARISHQNSKEGRRFVL